MRLLEGMLPAFFSVVEAVIFLLFGIAAMVLFISLPVAIPFAFFSLTEIIAASVLRAYLFLVLRTFVVATMLAFLVQMLIIFAERGTALVFIAISALTTLLSFQFVHMAASTVTGALNVIGSAVGSATGVSVRQTDPLAAAGRVAGMAALAGAAVATGGGAMVGAAALLHRQGGLRGGGLSAVGSAALHAARVRAGSATGRTPLGGLQRGYSSVQGYHQMAREHEYQLETARALLLDRDADEAAAILMEQKKSVSPRKREWAAKKVREWTSLEESRQKYRGDMRGAGMGRLAYRGYSRPWKSLSGGEGGGEGASEGRPPQRGVASDAGTEAEADHDAQANANAHTQANASATDNAHTQALALWSGADDRVRRQVLSDVRDLADRVGRGLPLNASALQGKLSHLSLDDRQRLVGMLQEGTISPDDMLRVLEATSEVADGLGIAGSVDGVGSAGSTAADTLFDEFLGPNGYFDLNSPGVASVLSLAASRGGEVQIPMPNNQGTLGTQDTAGTGGIPAADMALLISAGLGLKRALPWPQVKKAVVAAASLSDASDPVQAVSEGLGTPTLRTSMAPIKRFVETARYMGLSAIDVSTTLDVAAATSAHDMGGVTAVIAAISEKDETRRHTKWRAAGVPQNMVQPLDRVRSNALRQGSKMLSPSPSPASSPSAGSPDGTTGHRARERAEEMLGALLVEGMTISDELYSVPIETYSAHPFTVGSGAANATGATGATPAVTLAEAHQAAPGNERLDEVDVEDTTATTATTANHLPTVNPDQRGRPAPGAAAKATAGGGARKLRNSAPWGKVNTGDGSSPGPSAASNSPTGDPSEPEYTVEHGGSDDTNQR